MKTSKKKNFIQKMDERNKLMAYKVISIMYFLTIIAVQGTIIYRQFALGQDIHDFEDMAVIMTVNALFLISALLYFGAVQIQKLKITSLLLIYLAIVILGSIFTYVKYNVFQGLDLSAAQLFDKLLIIMAITGLILLFWVLFSFLGKRRLEREI